jgi:membrane fusion protein (multidrug efflux system)
VKTRIAQTELRAPFDGVIGLRQVSEGAYASPLTVISRLTKITPLKIEFSVNEAQANEIKNGTPLKFTIDNDVNQYRATVYAVESNLDRLTLTLKARALYPNPGGKLKPGRSAKIEIQLKELKNALVIPSLSTVTEMGRDIAYVYKNGKAHQITLRKGMRTSSSVQALDGLSAGDTLLVTGVMQLRDGMSVVIDSYVSND